MKYFEEKVHAGEWDEMEKHLSGFTKVDDNRYSMKIFFEIRKQKYLEALDRYCPSILFTSFESFPFLICIIKFTDFSFYMFQTGMIEQRL